MSFPIGTQPLSLSVFEKYIKYIVKYIWVTTLTFLGNVTSSVTWPFNSPYAISYRCSIVTKSLSPAIFEIMSPKHIGVTTLTFLGHVTSSVTWPIDPPYVIFYWCSIGTKPLSVTVFDIFKVKYIWVTTLTFLSLSPTIFEIMRPKHIWVTTLTFLGDVTSSVTWPIGPPYVISY